MKLRLAFLSLLLVGCTTASSTPPPDLLHSLQQNAWYVRTRDKQARLFVTSLGKGPRVVVLHGGWGADLLYMVGAIEPHLAEHEFVLFDQRGSLLSPHEGKVEDLTVEKLVDDLEQLRVELGDERLVLLGHSMGTRLAFEYARRYPDRIASLTLLGTFGPRGTGSEELWRTIDGRASALSKRPEVAQLMAREGIPPERGDEPPPPARVSTARWKIGFAAVNIVRLENWRKVEGGMVFYRGDSGEALGESAAKEWDLAAALGPRQVPVTVVQGDQDYVDPAASGWTTLTAEPLRSCVEVAVVRRAGHLAWVDDPRGVADGVRAGLARRRCLLTSGPTPRPSR